MSDGDPLLGHHAGLPYHLELLSDPWRVSAWKRAIAACVQPGDVVLDVGTGMGILAVWAARAGAARVIAVESTDIAEVAARVIEDNGVGDVVEVVHADLAGLPPQPVDVVLADFVGRLLPEAAMRRAVAAAAAWCTPRTRWLPRAVHLNLAPLADVEVPALERFEHALLGVDLRAAVTDALATPWSLTVGSDALLGRPRRVASLIPPELPEHVHIQTELHADPGVLRGLLAWFEADLGGGVTLDTGPGRRTFWGQVVWGLPRTELAEGASIQVVADLHSRVGEVQHTWRAQVQPAAPTASAIDPSHRPRLATPEGLGEGVPTEREPLASLIADLYRLGDPAALTLLTSYERRFGPHPLLRRT